MIVVAWSIALLLAGGATLRGFGAIFAPEIGKRLTFLWGFLLRVVTIYLIAHAYL